LSVACYNSENSNGGIFTKILILGSQARYETYLPPLPFIRQQEVVFLNQESSREDILAAAGDASILFVDAITPVPASVICSLPNLKMIHSEGVAFDKIDLAAAKARGIYVCNNKGCNAGAVAEQTVLLMLMLLRSSLRGDRAVRTGRQMEMKDRCMSAGIKELSDCRIGLVGYGDIAKAVAERLLPFGCELYYYTKHRRDREEEMQHGLTYLSLEELAATCDFVSLHCAVTEETRGMVDEHFLERMKNSAYLINTARGELVDNLALREALIQGKIAGAGLDTLSPEPVPADHPLVTMPAPAGDRIVLSPHLGGITEASFRRGHLHMWRNAERVADGHKPDNIVNGVE
jgi:phosphoglycerate dehydrogenase-like enzyme